MNFFSKRLNDFEKNKGNMVKNMCIRYYSLAMKKRTDVLFAMSVRLHEDVRSFEVKRTFVFERDSYCL